MMKGLHGETRTYGCETSQRFRSVQKKWYFYRQVFLNTIARWKSKADYDVQFIYASSLYNHHLTYFLNLSIKKNIINNEKNDISKSINSHCFQLNVTYKLVLRNLCGPLICLKTTRCSHTLDKALYFGFESRKLLLLASGEKSVARKLSMLSLILLVVLRGSLVGQLRSQSCKLEVHRRFSFQFSKTFLIFFFFLSVQILFCKLREDIHTYDCYSCFGKFGGFAFPKLS